MRRRVYWLLPDVESARSMMADLLAARIELRHVHFVGREDCDLSGLHAANVLQTSDLVCSAEYGLVVGAAFGGLLGLVAAASFPNAAGDPQWSLVAGLVVAGALVDAWTSSMIGVSAPNRRLRRFAGAIQQGRILLMADVPLTRVAEIEARLQVLHPEARPQGPEPGTPSFP